MGSLRDGISGDSQSLMVKSALDGVVSNVYAATFGWGVAASAVTVGVVQGALTVLGAVAGAFLTTRMVAELEAPGAAGRPGAGGALRRLTRRSRGVRMPIGSGRPR